MRARARACVCVCVSTTRHSVCRSNGPQWKRRTVEKKAHRHSQRQQQPADTEFIARSYIVYSACAICLQSLAEWIAIRTRYSDKRSVWIGLVVCALACVCVWAPCCALLFMWFSYWVLCTYRAFGACNSGCASSPTCALCVEAGAHNLLKSAYTPRSLSVSLSASLSQSSQTERKTMEIIFDCFFEETFRKLERSGLKARNKRKDVIDHLTAIVLGTSRGKELDGVRAWCEWSST